MAGKGDAPLPPLILAKQDGGVPGGNLLRPEAGNVYGIRYLRCIKLFKKKVSNEWTKVEEALKDNLERCQLLFLLLLSDSKSKAQPGPSPLPGCLFCDP